MVGFREPVAGISSPPILNTVFPEAWEAAVAEPWRVVWYGRRMRRPYEVSLAVDIQHCVALAT